MNNSLFSWKTIYNKLGYKTCKTNTIKWIYMSCDGSWCIQTICQSDFPKVDALKWVKTLILMIIFKNLNILILWQNCFNLLQSKANVMVNKSVGQNFEFESSFENNEESIHFKRYAKLPQNTFTNNLKVTCQTRLTKTSNRPDHVL